MIAVSILDNTFDLEFELAEDISSFESTGIANVCA